MRVDVVDDRRLPTLEQHLPRRSSSIRATFADAPGPFPEPSSPCACSTSVSRSLVETSSAGMACPVIQDRGIASSIHFDVAARLGLDCVHD